ncbi:hypothetical protein L6654_24220 [Bradyrhizobium sp. WYCCWR 13023]|uniref:Uncharacterized protein n=1 Tax=Bradyrhizobium zhengyangense TaxID=2911009 RepID=A0A9X1RBH8_9BRAD|nr:hypothetical protein [Bradyrhizobium zhengyangense]MCG2629734.1 hypothetical protein [Bradyrhizobium zhengyangense]
MISPKVIFGIAFSCFISPALADCDPVKILIQDQYRLRTDDQTSQKTDNSHTDNTNKNQNLDSTYYGFGAVTENESQQFSNAVSDRFQLDYKSSSKRWEAYTSLSDNAREAYTDCLKASDENIFILPDPSVKADATKIVLTVKVRPYIPQLQPIVMQSTFASDQEELPAAQATRSLLPGSSVAFTLNRDVSKPLTFTANVGTQSVPYVIPPQDPLVTKSELRYSKTTTTYGHPCDSCHDTHEICLELDPDDNAVLYPGSAHFNALKNVQDGIIHDMKLVGGYDPRKVCMQGGQNVRRDNANLSVCGYLVASVLVRVPRTQGHSQYAPPAYVSDKKTCL